MSAFVGREEPLARLLACFDACQRVRPASAPSWPELALVTGQAGMGKTALLSRFAEVVGGRGASVLWGTCWDAGRAPAWWPWTQALRSLVRIHPDLGERLAPQLRAVVAEHAVADPDRVHDATGRVRLLDGVARLLSHAAERAPVVVVLDDLQWSDGSSRELLRFLVRQPASNLMLACAYRPDEVAPDAATDIAPLAASAEHLPLRALRAEEVTTLVQSLAGAPAARRWAPHVYARSGGHPFFARELCHLVTAGDPSVDIPEAVRGAVVHRLGRLSPAARELLLIAAVAGTSVRPALLAEVSGSGLDAVRSSLSAAAEAGLIVPGRRDEPPHFAHDLYRETILDEVALSLRLALHARIAAALVERQHSGRPVFATELARHFAASVPVTGAAAAFEWARAAARADTARFAFAEAAGHLARARKAVELLDASVAADELVAILGEEGELWLRGGAADQARPCLEQAWTVAEGTGRAELMGVAALGLEACGARFAMPRAELVDVLERARTGLAGARTSLEAQVTAALARQLQHSVAAERPRAAPLAREAARLARTLDDPGTLANCLLALHDTLWTPGTAEQRTAVTEEITALARRTGDDERLTQALLLTATAQLERGSPAFRATLTEFEHRAASLRQPRHDYVVATRRAALVLLDGDTERGDELSVDAERLGHAVSDPDAGNVRMTQRLQIARARHDPAELSELAGEAVRWWVGLPTHAHAVAAGFLARAGDLNGARRELDTLVALPWRSDRSYMWSLFVGEVAAAAIALKDHAVCRELLQDVGPLASDCAVGGAFVSFMGCHAHTVGLLEACLGHHHAARSALELAVATHRRLGAATWLGESAAALLAVGRPPTSRDSQELPALVRVGDLWEACYRGQTAHLRDVKGLHDLAVLLARPGVDVAALDLAAASVIDQVPGQPVLDRTALSSYRRRLAELEVEEDEARSFDDLAGIDRAAREREALLHELRRATRPGGGELRLGTTAAERARKAVSARLRDAIRRIEEVLPELGAHLDRSVRTGTSCRYVPRD